MTKLETTHVMPQEIQSLEIKLTDTNATNCKYIVGEPTEKAVCCGLKVEAGKSWCLYHRQIVFENVKWTKHKHSV